MNKVNYSKPTLKHCHPYNLSTIRIAPILMKLREKPQEDRMYNVGVEPTSPALRQVFLPKLKLFYTSVPSERFELSLLVRTGF